MPHDSNSQFDQAVLDLIENSPIGAVPFTPAYRDALTRLYASHQVYGDADHKDGHVTARSLARLPLFHADNLNELISGAIGPEALEANDRIFDRYVASLTDEKRQRAEGMRLTVVGKASHHRAKHGVVTVHDPVHTVFLVPGTGPHPGLPGNYLYGSAFQLRAEANSPWVVQLHDSGDGGVVYDSPDMAGALGKLEEVLMSAPFTMTELSELGFRFT